MAKLINHRMWNAWNLTIYSKALLFGLIVLSVILLSLKTELLDLQLYGILIIWISVFPTLVYLQKPDWSPVPLLPFIGLFYIFFFALPIFATPLTFHIGDKVVMYNKIVLDGVQPAVALLVAGGVGTMFAAYYLSRSTFMRRWPVLHIPNKNIDPGALQALYWLLIISSLSYRYSSTLQSVPSIGQFLDPVGYLGLGGLFLQWRGGHLPLLQKALIILIVLPLEAHWRLLSYNLFVAIMLMVFFVFILLREGKFKVIPVLAVVGAVFVASYSVSLPMRFHADANTLTGKASVYGKYVADLTEINKGATVKLPNSNVMVSYDPRISPLIHRLGQIWIFQYVYDLSPQKVPYWTGESYFPFFTSFIPRMIFPNKPEEKTGSKFGFVYGITDIEDGTTSFNLPWITELFVNFGPVGVIIGMAFFGLLFAGLDKLFNSQKMGEPEFLIGLTLIFRLWYQESNFSVMTGSTFPLFICLYIYFRYGGNIVNRLMLWAKLRQNSP